MRPRRIPLVVLPLASVIAVVFAVLVVYATRLAPGPVPRMAARVLALGYAVPGTVLAVGVLLPLGAIDGAIADAVRQATGTSPGLVLTGTTVALIYAYQVRYFAVAWNGIEPGFARITPAMDAAARSLGCGTAATFRRVHAPLLARSAAARAALAAASPWAGVTKKGPGVMAGGKRASMSPSGGVE